MPKLDQEQVRFFRDTGYFRIANVLNSAETTALRQFLLAEKAREDAERLQSGTPGKAIKFYGLYDRSPQLMNQLITHPNLLGPLQSILGPNVVFVKNRHNHATVNDGTGPKSEARLHRDILQPSRGLLTAAVYLEESNLTNGCTNVVPGSQFLPYVGVPQSDGGGTWMEEHSEYHGLLEQALPVPMPEGGVLLFDGLIFHGVGLNLSGKTRMSITLGFRAADELDLQPDAERQLIISGQHIYRGNDR